MFEFIFKMFIGSLSICKIGSFGPTLFNINASDTLLYPFTINVNECGGSCSTIDDPYPRVYVPNKAKNINVKVFNFMSRVNEARFLVQHESCECKCALNETVFDLKQKWIMMNVCVSTKN